MTDRRHKGKVPLITHIVLGAVVVLVGAIAWYSYASAYLHQPCDPLDRAEGCIVTVTGARPSDSKGDSR